MVIIPFEMVFSVYFGQIHTVQACEQGSQLDYSVYPLQQGVGYELFICSYFKSI